MSRAAFLPLLFVGLSAAAQQPAPPIQNGRIETRQTTDIERELTSLAAGATDPIWAGWRVPIVDGQRAGCCTYSDDVGTTRGCFVENSTWTSGRERPQIAASNTVSLEAGTGVVILARIADRRVERLRTLSDDCPVDASGRTVYWLPAATTAGSLKFLETLVQQSSLTTSQERRLPEAALSAAALHRDPGADAMLDRIATGSSDTSLRRLARSLLGSARGAHGLATLRQLLEQERLPEIRRQLVNAVGQSRQPEGVEALLGVAKRDWDAKVRAEAAYWLPQRGGTRVLSDVTSIIENDTSDNVKQRAVQGIGRLPADESTTVLIQFARTTTNAAVRKEAVSALGRSKDPKAVAYLEELIRK